MYNIKGELSTSEMFQVIWDIPDDVAKGRYHSEAISEMRLIAERASARAQDGGDGDNIIIERCPCIQNNPDDNVVAPWLDDNNELKKLDADHDGDREPWEFPF